MPSQPPPGKPDLAILIGRAKHSGKMPPPGSDDPNPDARQEQDEPQGDSPAVRPEWVDYHTGEETCQNCEYMQGSNCTVLQMPVGPSDHCEAWEPKGGSDSGMGMDSDAG